ncbi:MAG: hypothetical protein HW412_297 [Bacteroidetes bacterium]|nr:hypothetical protein [Bacteroidota bacterium]
MSVHRLGNGGIMGLAHASGLSVISHQAKWALAVIVCLTSFSCFNQSLEPVTPSWDTNLSIPLANRLYTLSEIVRKDTSILHVGVGGQIVYATSVQASPTYIGDLITLTLRDTSLRMKFGAFKIDVAPVDIPIQIPWLPQGSTVPIPDTTINVSDLRDTIDSFQRVTLSQGTISLTLQNNLPVPMLVMNPIRLIDASGVTVSTFVFNPPTILPNSSRTASDDLAEKSLDNVITIAGMSLYTPGSQTPVTIPFGTLFSARLSTTGLKARQAVFASIPPQRLTDNDTTHVTVDDSTLIRELNLRTGSLNLSFTNRVDLDMMFKYRLNELLRNSGGSYVPYEDSIFLPAHGSGSQVVTLGGTRIQAQGQQLLRSLEIISSVILPIGSVQPVTVNDTDRVLVNVTRTVAIVADSATGVLKPTWLGINTVAAVNFGDLPTRFSGEIRIPAATLALWTASTIGFPMDISLRIGARKSAAGDSAFLSMPFSQKRVQRGSDLILFDQGDVGNFLSQFSGRLPSELRIEGRALVNPPDAYNPTPAGVGAIGRNSSLSGRADLQVPLMMGIVNGIYKDTVALGDTTADGRKDYTINKNRINDVNSGSIFIEVKNAMPAQVGFSLRLLDIGKQSLLRVPQSGQEIPVAAAAVDAEGNVTVPANSTASFSLNENEVRQFNPAEFLTYSISIVTTPGAPAVRFKTSDYVQVRMWSTLSYRVNR